MANGMELARADGVHPRMAPWRRRIESLTARPLLPILILIDITFILLHLWCCSDAELNGQFDIEVDGSVPEWFNYLKWLASAGACTYAFLRRGEPLYFAWAVLFIYFLLDDVTSVHEQLGWKIVAALDLAPALLLRAVDFGELMISLTVGAAILGPMALLYCRAGYHSDSRKFTQHQLPWLGLLIFCGVITDMVHVMTSGLGFPVLSQLCVLVEDGGEMIAASFLTANSVSIASKP